jgi:ABC-type Zn uptake system ZnuABC Zn-binding protein ZnuA
VNKLLEVFSSNSESIESNFTSLRQRIDDLEQNVIGAIKEEKQKAITSLQD